MERLVVHVGPPKTATTYIQHALHTNRDVLVQHGVYLPVAGRSELAPTSVSHHNLGWELNGSRRFSESQGGWRALSDELAKVDAETVLLSSEILALAVARGAATALDQRLLALGRRVTIVYTVRDPLSYINSSYGQQVKAFETKAAFVDFVESMLSSGEPDLERQTSHWYDSPDFDFVAIPFPGLVERDPLVALLNAARIDVPAGQLLTSGEPSNITLGPVAVAAFRLLRHYLEGLNPAVSRDDLPLRKLHRVAARAAKDAGWCEEPFWGWTPESAAAAAAQLAESNERFAQAVWGTPWPLPMPVDQAQAHVARVLDLRGRGLPKVQDFVAAMGKRYVGLLNDEERSAAS